MQHVHNLLSVSEMEHGSGSGGSGSGSGGVHGHGNGIENGTGGDRIDGGADDGRKLRLNAIKVLTVEGLVSIEGEEAWLSAVRGIQEAEWMDGEVRVVVEAGLEE